MEVKAVEQIGNHKIYYNDFGMGFVPCELQSLEMTAKEMFEKLGYEKVNERLYKKLHEPSAKAGLFDNYIRIVFLDNKTISITKTIGIEELKAINKQIEELGWDNE